MYIYIYFLNIYWSNLYTQGWTHDLRSRATCSFDWASQMPQQYIFKIVGKSNFEDPKSEKIGKKQKTKQKQKTNLNWPDSSLLGRTQVFISLFFQSFDNYE